MDAVRGPGGRVRWRGVAAAAAASLLAAVVVGGGVAVLPAAAGAPAVTVLAGQTRVLQSCWSSGNVGDPVHLQRWRQSDRRWVTIVKARKSRMASSVCRSRIGVRIQWRPTQVGTVRLRLFALETDQFASFASAPFTYRVVRAAGGTTPSAGPPSAPAPTPVVTVTAPAVTATATVTLAPSVPASAPATSSPPTTLTTTPPAAPPPPPPTPANALPPADYLSFNSQVAASIVRVSCGSMSGSGWAGLYGDTGSGTGTSMATGFTTVAGCVEADGWGWVNVTKNGATSQAQIWQPSRDSVADLAGLHHPSLLLPGLRLHDFDPPPLTGSWVAGFALDSSGSLQVATGSITSVGSGADGDIFYIGTTLTTTPDFAGGPLVDNRGEVVGYFTRSAVGGRNTTAIATPRLCHIVIIC